MTRSTWAAGICAATLGGCWLDAAVPSWRLSPDLGHAWALPLLVAFLYWERWSERPPTREAPVADATAWFALAASIVAAAPVRLLLTPYPLWPAALLGYTLTLAGTAAIAGWVCGGKPMAIWVLRPLVLVLAGIPLPSAIDMIALLPLRSGIAALAAEVSNLLGHPALAAGTSVRLANGWVGVEEACSGIRSLQAALLFGLFFGEWYRFGWRRRVVLVVLALAAAVAGNFGRVLFLTLYAANGGVLDRVHDSAGWTAMIASLGITTWLAVHWGGYRLPVSQRSGATGSRSRYAGAWLWFAAAGFAAISVGTHGWFLTTPPAARMPQWTVRFPVAQRSFQSEPLSETAREMLRPDRFASGRWKDSGNREIESYFIEWTHGQVARSVPFLHNPTVCLPYAGCELMASLPPIEVPSAAGPVRFFAYRFQRAGQSLLVAFTIWDPSRGALLERPEEYRSWWRWLGRQWRDVREHRRDQPAQLLAVSIVADESGRSDLEQLLRTLVVSPSVGVRPGA